MSVTQHVDVLRIGRAFASAVRNDASAQQMFVKAQNGTVDVWLVTEPLSFHDEDRFYAAAAQLYRAFPETALQFHLVNPRRYGNDSDIIDNIVPSDADRVSLHAKDA